nr:hypothetical protein CFP56_72106 [Quercus suber]
MKEFSGSKQMKLTGHDRALPRLVMDSAYRSSRSIKKLRRLHLSASYHDIRPWDIGRRALFSCSPHVGLTQLLLSMYNDDRLLFLIRY